MAPAGRRQDGDRRVVPDAGPSFTRATCTRPEPRPATRTSWCFRIRGSTRSSATCWAGPASSSSTTRRTSRACCDTGCWPTARSGLRIVRHGNRGGARAVPPGRPRAGLLARGSGPVPSPLRDPVRQVPGDAERDVRRRSRRASRARRDKKRRLGLDDKPLAIFIGSLYPPNEEAAAFICTELAPALAGRDLRDLRRRRSRDRSSRTRQARDRQRARHRRRSTTRPGATTSARRMSRSIRCSPGPAPTSRCSTSWRPGCR